MLLLALWLSIAGVSTAITDANCSSIHVSTHGVPHIEDASSFLQISSKMHARQSMDDTQTGTGAISPADAEKILHLHNVYRCMHGVPKLEWSDELARTAQAWARKSCGGPDDYYADCMRHSPGIPDYGENLAVGTYMSAGSAVRSWYDEIKETPGGKGLLSGPVKGLGHYTAMMWKATTQIGCGSEEMKDEEHVLWVCHYLPRGNILGKYADNVLGLKYEQSQCDNPQTAAVGGSTLHSQNVQPSICRESAEASRMSPLEHFKKCCAAKCQPAAMSQASSYIFKDGELDETASECKCKK